MKFLLIVFAAFFTLSVKAQDYRIVIKNYPKNLVPKISDAVSIDKISQNEIIAFANEKEFAEFKKLKIAFSAEKLKSKPIKKAADMSLKTATDISEMADFNLYPSYNVYLEMMDGFIKDYPEIASLEEIGESVEGRKILALKITGTEKAENLKPEVFLTSTMHGDEVCGFVLMLRLADFLLKNYYNNSEVNSILNNINLYINPLSNPDGTYHGGDDDISSARRYNAQNVDLNRNFPRLETFGRDFNPEKETSAMIDFANKHNFVVSANFHAGDEVVNYPWDSYYESDFTLADKQWFVDASRQYVETARLTDEDYMKSVDKSGYIFGSDWYKVSGGRQDYMLFFKRCREFTIELSSTKLLPVSDLDFFWQKNEKSLLNFLKLPLQGLTGRITDSYGTPVKAQISIKNYDQNNSSVFSREEDGIYFRPLTADKDFEVCVYADGFKTECQTVTTKKDENIALDFVLTEGVTDYSTATETTKKLSDISVIISDNKIKINSLDIISKVEIVDVFGHIILQDNPEKTLAEYSSDNYKAGIYVIKVKAGGWIKTHKVLITK